MRIATSLISVDQAQQEPRARDRADATRFDAGRGARPAAVGRQARRDRGRGRDRRPADDALLEPLPAQPVSELGVREHRHRGAPATDKHAVQSSTDSTAAEHADADRRDDRRRQGLRQQRLLGHLPDRCGRPTRCSTPTHAGELVDGFVQQYRDGGWIARWSSPGYANLMTGTSSDVAFADAYVKGVAGFDAKRRLRRRAQERDRRAAGHDPNDPNVGRKGLQTVALPRLHADRRRRGRVVGARGLHQRLRHRATWRRRWPPSRARRRPSAALRGGVRVLPQPRHATT